MTKQPDTSIVEEMEFAEWLASLPLEWREPPVPPPRPTAARSSREASAGMVLEDRDGTRYLVGSVNERLGGCNCCELLQPHEIARWAMLPGIEPPR